MKRAFTVGVCIAMLALTPVVAQAQEGPPPPPPGYTPPPPPPEYQPPPPQQYQQPPPQQYQPPPQQYQQQPPPQYYQPPPQYYAPPPPAYYTARPRAAPNGIGAIIVGSIMLGLGIILAGSSVILWDAGCGAGHVCFGTGITGVGAGVDPNQVNSDNANAAGALSLDIVGGILFTVGAIVLPIGIVQAARYNGARSKQRVKLEPAATGLKLTF
jgi:hypothetical protein